MRPLKVKDLHAGQEVWIQAAEDMPCCVVYGNKVFPKGKAMHPAIINDVSIKLAGDDKSSVKFEFIPPVDYVDNGFDKTATDWFVNHECVEGCLFGKAQPSVSCNCDISMIMNIGCPSTRGEDCPS